jgi:hypothetical protein
MSPACLQRREGLGVREQSRVVAALRLIERHTDEYEALADRAYDEIRGVER